MNAGVEHLQAVLARAAQAGTEVNLHELLGRMTMEVVGTTAFGRALPRAREPVHVAMIHSKYPCGAHVQQVSRALTHSIETWEGSRSKRNILHATPAPLLLLPRSAPTSWAYVPWSCYHCTCVTDRSSRAGCRRQLGQQCDRVHALMVRRCGGQG